MHLLRSCILKGATLIYLSMMYINTHVENLMAILPLNAYIVCRLICWKGLETVIYTFLWKVGV